MRLDAHYGMLPEHAFEKRGFGSRRPATLEGGGKGGGGGGQPQTTTAYQTNLPEYAKPYVMNMLGAAQNQLFTTTPGKDGAPGEITGFRPYQPYSTDPTKYFAGPSQLQQQVYGEAGQMQTPGAFGAAQTMAGLSALGQMGAGGRYQQMATDPTAIQAYMSPFMQNVVDVQKSQALRDYQKGIPALRAQAAGQGAFGGSRLAIQEAEAQRSLLSNLAQIQAQGTQSAFQNAQQAQQFGANLGLQGLAGASQTAGMLGQLGGAQQQADLARLGFQQQTGAQQQQLQQNIINQAVQDYATAQQYPLMQLSAMSSLLRGLPLQSATTQTYQAAPSMTSQLAGLGTAGIGAYGLGRATGIFKEGGQVKGYKYGGAISSDKLQSMAHSLSIDQLQAQLRDPTLTTEERQIFADALTEKSRGQMQAGLGAAPATNMENLAGGGIVAFANEGYVQEDDDEEDDSTGVSYAGQEDDAELVDSILAAGVPAGAYGRGLAAAPSGSGIRAEARAPRGLDADTFVEKIMARESGGRRYDKEGKLLTSSKGALGEMQVMPGTIRDPGFGVRAAKDDSPQEIARVGKDYATMLLARYEDPKVAAIAYNWGPGNTDKWLAQGADIDKLPNETKKYIRGLKDGGAIRFQNKGRVEDPLGYMQQIDVLGGQLDLARKKLAETKPPGVYERSQNPEAYKNYQDLLANRDRLQKEYETLMETAGMNRPAQMQLGKNLRLMPAPDPLVQKMIGASNAPTTEADWAQFDTATEKYMTDRDARLKAEKEAADRQDQENEKLLQTVTGGATPSSSPEEVDSLTKMLAEKEAGIKSQRAIDANLALIMAGLGAAGGTSKNALENIAKGAQLGLGTYMTSAKQRSQEERDIMSGRLGLRRLKGLEDIRAAQIASNQEGKIGQLIGSREKQLEQQAFNNITKTGLMIDSAEGQAAIAKEVARLKSQDPFLAKLYRQYGLPAIQSTGAGAPKRSPDDIKKQYNIS